MNRADLLRGASLACGALALGEDGVMQASAAAEGADAELDALFAEDRRDFYRRHPETASYEGEHSEDERWDDPSEAAAADEAAHQREVLARLARFDHAKLSETGRTNLDLYAAQLREAIRGYELRTYLFALNQRSGVQTDISIVDNLPFA
ncbi:MAG: DUF885 family protein, partial [Candidatus Eremiobacteraeota bacterium]|nr:DUF885 family protein [Candidatus Eremiobacteraeota bacterium]